VNWEQEEKGFLGFKDPSSAISLPFERKGKGCRSYRGYKEDRAFLLSFKRRLDKVTAKKRSRIGLLFLFLFIIQTAPLERHYY
jgi:hypothetical protein